MFRRAFSNFSAAVLACSGLCVSNAASPSTLAPDLESAGLQQLDFIRGLVFEWAPREKPLSGSTTPATERGLSLAGREDLFAVYRWSQLPVCQSMGKDPIGVIRDGAKRSRIVIVNEHHDSSADRLFIGRVLQALRSDGFQLYAAETFARDHDVNHSGVAASDGIYLNEPVFGRMVEKAKTLGYQLVAYEYTKEQDAALARSNPELSPQARREQLQAANLVSAIFSRQPDAKVVIHVGHSHVRERLNAAYPETKWMAQILKEITGTDPLTISQLSCRSGTSRDEIAAQAEGTLADGAVDLFVGHPTATFRKGRPAWRKELGDRPVAVPDRYSRLQERVIIEARPVNASPGTVATDRLLQYPDEHLYLMLPRGTYRIEAFSEHGSITDRVVIRVP